ncbi:MAG: GIY-YIG nuclease family protein [Vampirovibrionales bacterium]
MNYCVYILTNKSKSVIYTGVTNNLQRRLYEHDNKLCGGFTSRYNVNQLVYFEQTCSIESAILREKQIKSWSRYRKNQLIESMNPQWQSLNSLVKGDEIATAYGLAMTERQQG